MKRIVKGKLYDTGKIEEIGIVQRSISTMEHLCRTEKGAFFLWRRDHFDNNPDRDSTIHPIDEEEAKLWVAKFVSAEKYIELFGEVEEA